MTHGTGYDAAVRVAYIPLCAALGVVLGWLPRLFHGPIPEKFDLYYLHGSTIVWAWYTARMLIGFMVGITHWPERWWLRGPLVGALVILPLGFISLGTPTCGPRCMIVNTGSGAGIGLLVGGVAWWITGRSRACDGAT